MLTNEIKAQYLSTLDLHIPAMPYGELATLAMDEFLSDGDIHHGQHAAWFRNHPEMKGKIIVDWLIACSDYPAEFRWVRNWSNCQEMKEILQSKVLEEIIDLYPELLEACIDQTFKFNTLEN